MAEEKKLSQKKRILITGGSGLLALNWAFLQRDDHEIILGLHERVISLEGVKTVKLEIDDPDHCKTFLDKQAVDLVVHTAALTSVEICEADPLLAQKVNVGISATIAGACADAGVPLIHISTDHLFSGDQALVSESEPVHPLNEYARSKANAEQVVLETHTQSIIARTNFFGWGTAYRHSFSDFIIRKLRGKESIRLFEDVFYTPILIHSLVSALMELADMQSWGVFNITGDERLSKLEFGYRIAEQFGLDKNLIQPSRMSEVLTTVARPLDMSLSNNKARTMLGRGLGTMDQYINDLKEQEDRGFASLIEKVG